MRLKPSLILLLLVVGLAGCGSGKDKGSGSGPSGPKSTKTASTGGDASPTPTASVPDDTAPTDVAGTLQDLWQQLREGSFPTAVVLYDKRVTKRMGGRTIIGALRAVNGNFAARAPTIERTRKTPSGTLVEVRFDLPAPHQDVFGSYLLKRRGKRYVIGYDSFLSTGIQTYIRDKVQRRIDPGATNPSPRAIQAAKTMVERYDALFAPRG
jgi:hypothetical protein